MYWQEEKDQAAFVVPDNIVDLVFSIRCSMLPIDHAHSLSDEIGRVLPWFEDEKGAGLHTIRGAESGNGWERPEGPDTTIYLSRRTKLVLRLPKERIAEAKALEGQSLLVSGHPMEVRESHSRLLSASKTLYARYVTFDGGDGENENVFMLRSVDELRARHFKFKKILCGKVNVIATKKGSITTRSLMVADLPPDEAVRLQEEGLGELRKCGCGLFIPHKSV
jgi:CRISPR-associated protein Cas6